MSSEKVVRFTDDMRRENIKSFCWYLLFKYMDGGSRCPVLLSVLTGKLWSYLANEMFLRVKKQQGSLLKIKEYMRDCQVPGNSFLFAKVLTLLVLSREVEEKKEEEDFRVVVVKKIYDTLMQLKGLCAEELEPVQSQLEDLLGEARCQVIVAYLMFDDVDSALAHWKEFYQGELTNDPLGHELLQILEYLSNESYRKSQDEEMNLSINLFFSDHKLVRLCRDVQEMVRACCTYVLPRQGRTMKYNLRSATNYYASKSPRSTRSPCSTSKTALKRRTRKTSPRRTLTSRTAAEGAETVTENSSGKEEDAEVYHASSTGSTSSSPTPKRSQLPRSAKTKATKTVTLEATPTYNDDVLELSSSTDDTLEATPLSKLPTRVSPVHFKRSYLTIARSSSSKSRPTLAGSRPIGFRKPVKKSVKFSVQETEYLVAGIKRYGFGNWAMILSMYPFHPSRSKVSLKDKARNLKGRQR